MRWNETEEIAIALADTHPEVDPLKLRFTEMHALICALEEFDDDPDASNERVLEAILSAWLEEID